MPHKPFRSARLRVMVINGHVGVPIRNGVIRWAMGNLPKIHVLLAQDIRDAQALKRALGPTWVIFPHEQPGTTAKTEAMTYICYRLARFECCRIVRNRDITHGEDHPRRMTAIGLTDKVTGQMFDFASVHAAPLGQGFIAAPQHQRNIHIEQVKEYVRFFKHEADPESIWIAGGNFNERLAAYVPQDLYKHCARGLFRKAGMVAAHRLLKIEGEVRMMEIFLNTHGKAHVRRRRTVYIPKHGMDHEVVVVTMRVHKVR